METKNVSFYVCGEKQMRIVKTRFPIGRCYDGLISINWSCSKSAWNHAKNVLLVSDEPYLGGSLGVRGGHERHGAAAGRARRVGLGENERDCGR